MGDLQAMEQSSGQGTFTCAAKQFNSIGMECLEKRSCLAALPCEVANILGDLPRTPPENNVLAVAADLMLDQVSLLIEENGHRFDMPTGEWSNVVSMFCCTSDGGSDEVFARGCVHTVFARDVRTLVFDDDCFEHGYHLMVHEGLKAADTFMWETSWP